MNNGREIEELCVAVTELAEHVRKVALGMQGLNVDDELSALVARVDKIRCRVKS